MAILPQQLLALGGQRFHQVALIAHRREQHVAAFAGGGGEAHGSAEAGFGRLGAGKTDDGGHGAPPCVELILAIVIEHLIQDRQAGGVAGADAEDHLGFQSQAELFQFHTAAHVAVAQDGFRAREQPRFHRPARVDVIQGDVVYSRHGLEEDIFPLALWRDQPSLRAQQLGQPVVQLLRAQHPANHRMNSARSSGRKVVSGGATAAS